MFLGLRSVIYPAPDLDAAKAWWTKALGIEPYFDEPFYVGYEIGGYELGLHPAAEVTEAFWGVADIDAAYASLLEAGAEAITPIMDVGGDIRVATLREQGGGVLGIIFNPHFRDGS
jgi:catechol 2,3-dioxygenase-like lactoylglutathione lyase family enzyme